MGCNEDKIKKFLLITFVVMLIVTAITPPQITLADSYDVVKVSFNPAGVVDGNVTPLTYDYGAVTMSSSEESGDFTLTNEGTIAMQCTVYTNVTTDETNMECDGNGGTLAEDFFSMNFTTTSLSGADSFISNSSGSQTTLETSLAGSTSDTFRITIHVGTCSADHGGQNTSVNFTFAAA
jgi:hypothetical protein